MSESVGRRFLRGTIAVLGGILFVAGGMTALIAAAALAFLEAPERTGWTALVAGTVTAVIGYVGMRAGGVRARDVGHALLDVISLP